MSLPKKEGGAAGWTDWWAGGLRIGCHIFDVDQGSDADDISPNLTAILQWPEVCWQSEWPDEPDIASLHFTWYHWYLLSWATYDEPDIAPSHDFTDTCNICTQDIAFGQLFVPGWPELISHDFGEDLHWETIFQHNMIAPPNLVGGKRKYTICPLALSSLPVNGFPYLMIIGT